MLVNDRGAEKDIELGAEALQNGALTRSGAPPAPPPKPAKFSSPEMERIAYPSPKSPAASPVPSKTPSSSTTFRHSNPNSPSSPIEETSMSISNTPTIADALPKRRSQPIPFTLLAHNFGYASGLTNIVCGPIIMAWYEETLSRPASRDLLFVSSWCGIYCVALGFFTLVFEYFFGLAQITWLPGEGYTGRSPVRGLFYVASSVGCFFSYPSILSGAALFFSGVSNLMAFKNGEVVDGSNVTRESYLLCHCTGSKPQVQDDHGNAETKNELGVWERLIKWIKHQQEIGNFGQVVLVGVYVLINVALWTQRLFSWFDLVELNQRSCSPQNMFDCVSNYAPWAKAFGQTLNFNCALILLPVLKTLLRKLNNFQVLNSGKCQRFLPPLRKNIVFHKFIALFVLGGTVGHVFFHFLNFMSSPEATTAVFTPMAFVSGYIITGAMYVIYAAAQNRVKRASYEVFWWSHHAFVVFFFFLLIHAPKFWAWGMVPLAAYAAERIYREFKSQKKFLVSKVVYNKPVLCLSFFPERAGDFMFKEGQYLYVLSPSISKWEWHPFTISSAHEDLECKDGEVTLHIRVQDDGSWTNRLCKMFATMAPASGKRGENFTLTFNHMDKQGTAQRGKHLGPNGLPLICIDGPHAAPAQHYNSYEEIMLVGAGIGLTPSSAILQSILKHKWKKGFSPKTVYFVFVVRHSEIFSFRWFIKLLTELEKTVAGDFESRSLDRAINRLQIHLFITGAPELSTEKIQRQPSLGSSNSKSIVPDSAKQAIRAGIDVNIGFKDTDLEMAMLNPTVSSKSFVNTIASHSRVPENNLNDIWVWNGRPMWDDIFSYVKLSRQPNTDRVGVCFCGTPFIGKDLKTFCHKYSSLNEGIIFSLHKENF